MAKICIQGMFLVTVDCYFGTKIAPLQSKERLSYGFLSLVLAKSKSNLYPLSVAKLVMRTKKRSPMENVLPYLFG